MSEPATRRSGEFERVVSEGGVVLFPSDTVYGVACDPENADAIARLYALKGRPDDKSAAVMFFDRRAGLHAFRGLGEKTHDALHNLLPGKVTVLLPNPSHRFPLACRADPETIGLRIISVPQLEGITIPVLQSSANRSGAADARRLDDVDPVLIEGADLVIDGGELAGVPSTVVDLRDYERDGVWSIVRLGAVDGDTITAALEGRFHFDPSTYSEMVRGELPEYDDLQDAVAEASGTAAARILHLGTGTGETAVRLRARHPSAVFVAVDENPKMLAVARERLGDRLVGEQVGMLQEALPAGPFDLVSSALAIHHLDAGEKAELFRRVRQVLAPGGRFVLGDLVIPPEGPGAVRGATDGYDKPDTIDDQVRWLKDAGFAEVELVWRVKDLAVIVAKVPA